MSDSRATIAFVGTPNCGKSSLFNALTGMRQKVGNFPGVTVAPKASYVGDERNGRRLLDLPGIYSLAPKTNDEQLTIAALKGEQSNLPRPDAVLFVIDGSNLEKSLFLYAQFARLGLPTLLAVTMIDAVKAGGGALDDIALERALGLKVKCVVGHKGVGLPDVRASLLNSDDFTVPPADGIPGDDIDAQFSWARKIAARVARSSGPDKRSRAIDRYVLHPFIGPAIFTLVMLLFFQSIFTWATPLMDGIESLMGQLAVLVEYGVAPGLLQNFLTKGIIGGVGSVLVFLPQILILYLFITLLEDFGYLARAAFLVDRLMGVFGLQGRSFIPLLGSYACAIPGIMSARIIPSEKDRLTTILIAPLMTCSARLPVYVLLIAAFVPDRLVAGLLSLQGIILLALYVLAALAGLLIARILKSTLLRGDSLPFLLELPPYRRPSLRNVGLAMMQRAGEFLRSAGTIILAMSIALWALSEYPRADQLAAVDSIEAESLQLEESALGSIGKLIQPLFEPIGFDWKVSIGVLGSFAAREVFVSVMGQMYSVDVSESDESLRTVLQRSISLPAALSILAFYVFALQCMSTIAVMRRETSSWKWPIFAFAYTFVLAYGAAWATYTICSALI